VEVVRTVAAFTERLAGARREGREVGLVPTMGALHAGHRSLVDRARADHDHVAVSIFVNPLQFERGEDLASYPRDLDADVAVCAGAGVATVFAPSVQEMYPRAPLTTVHVAEVSEPFEGQARPGHFDGVATVVAKLFSAAGACAAYFGEKDFQQLAVVRRMVADLSMPVRVVACPTVRAPDGLALSSRNRLLSDEERQSATVLWRALSAGARAVADGEVRPAAVAAVMAAVVAAEPRARLDYAAAVDASDLSVPRSLADPVAARLLVAARVGPARLIDNCDARAMAGSPDGCSGAARRLVHGQEGR
jgi:pantoate--beta-alanine ligase